MWKRSRIVLLSCLFLGASLPFLQGCERDKPAKPPAEKTSTQIPTLRLYALAGAAGAIEPCGCVKDMLGGIDHAAAWIASQKKRAPQSLVLGAGPMFFADPKIEEGSIEQARFKAEAMASSLNDLGLEAWAPGANDWTLGTAQFTALSKETGAAALAANLGDGAGAIQAMRVLMAGGMKVGIVGVSIPRVAGHPERFKINDASVALTKGRASFAKQGVELSIALVAAQRGEALRLIESNPGFQVAIIGKAYDQGEANDQAFSPEVIGETLVVQATNHLQGISVIDLYVREGKHSFQDGSGLDFMARRTSLTRQRDELSARIASWKKDESGMSAGELAAQEKKLKELSLQIDSLKSPALPKDGSYFLYDLVEVREEHGRDGKVASRFEAYYRKVNEHNKRAFAGKLPKPPGEGQASYVGVDVCSTCHLEERAVWDKTRHSGAYQTLSVDHKEFNLDCVSCHVTGYEKPGGSTVTHVENLTNVQCEVCHGPGSRHVANPADLSLIRAAPSKSLCASSCHHVPHVGPNWKVDDAWPQILGKGHGKPK